MVLHFSHLGQILLSNSWWNYLQIVLIPLLGPKMKIVHFKLKQLMLASGVWSKHKFSTKICTNLYQILFVNESIKNNFKLSHRPIKFFFFDNNISINLEWLSSSALNEFWSCSVFKNSEASKHGLGLCTVLNSLKRLVNQLMNTSLWILTLSLWSPMLLWKKNTKRLNYFQYDFFIMNTSPCNGNLMPSFFSNFDFQHHPWKIWIGLSGIILTCLAIQHYYKGRKLKIRTLIFVLLTHNRDRDQVPKIWQ